MTYSVTPQASPLGGRMVQETSASATPNLNVTGASGTLFLIDVDNSLNSSAVYLKMWDNAAPVVGTTPADWVWKIPANQRHVQGFTTGMAFGTALSFAVVQAADQANAASPLSAVAVRLLTS